MSQIFPSGKNVSDKYDLKAIDPTKVLPKMDLRQIAQSHTRAYEETQGYSLSNNEGATSAQQPNLSIINTINIGSYEKDLAQLIQTYVASNSYLDVDGASTANNIILAPRKIADIISPNGINYAKPTSLPFAYRDNLKFTFRATLSNTGAVQISIKDNELSGLTGSISLVDEAGVNLAGGEIIAGKFYEIVLTGTGGVQKGVLIQPTIDTSNLIGEYSNATLYNIGSVVKELGNTKLYNSLTNSNIGNPLNSPTHWEFLSDLRAPSNVVLVKQESDFGVAVGDAITLVDNTNYIIGVTQLIMTKRLILPDTNPNISISGSSYSNTSIVYVGNTGANGFFSSNNAGTLNLFFLAIIDGVGNNRLFNLSSLVTLAGDVYGNFLQFIGWGSLGNITNFTVFTLKGVKILRCGSLDVQGNDLTSVNFSDCLFYSPTVIGGAHLNLKGSVQSNISQSSFFLAQGDSVTNIDPAINQSSTVSIGTSIGFTGYVVSGIRGVINLGGGQVRVIVALGHSFNNGQSVFIQSTINYNGLFTVSNVLPTNGTYGTFDITATFVTDETYGVALLMNGAAPKVESFFKLGSTGNITAYASNGAGGTRVTSNAHGRANGSTLYISEDTSFDYTGGYTIFGVTANTFDIPKAFVANDASGVWNSGSLDQTNNVVNTFGTGSIIPDSQTILDASTSTILAFAGTTTFSQVIWTVTNSWTAHQSERFSINRTTGVVTFIGDRQTKCYINLELNCAKSGGGTVEVRMNPMYRPVGGVFTEVARPRAIQAGSSSNMQVIRSGIILTLNFGDSIAFGMALDAAATLNINSALFQSGIA